MLHFIHFIHIINEGQAFFIGFWTMMSLLLAGLYIVICCGNDFRNGYNILTEKVDNYIDDYYGATAKKISNDTTYTCEA
jgi:hypothetical protein